MKEQEETVVICDYFFKGKQPFIRALERQYVRSAMAADVEEVAKWVALVDDKTSGFNHPPLNTAAILRYAQDMEFNMSLYLDMLEGSNQKDPELSEELLRQYRRTISYFTQSQLVIDCCRIENPFMGYVSGMYQLYDGIDPHAGIFFPAEGSPPTAMVCEPYPFLMLLHSGGPDVIRRYATYVSATDAVEAFYAILSPGMRHRYRMEYPVTPLRSTVLFGCTGRLTFFERRALTRKAKTARDNIFAPMMELSNIYAKNGSCFQSSAEITEHLRVIEQHRRNYMEQVTVDLARLISTRRRKMV